MTTTPESWDDVGCLQLKVDCVSHEVEDIRSTLAACHDLSESKLQKLRDELTFIRAQVQEQKKEQQEKKERVFVVGIAFLFGCVFAVLCCALALQILGSPQRSTQTLLDNAWKMYSKDVEVSGATALEPSTVQGAAAQAGKKTQSNRLSGDQIQRKLVNEVTATRTEEKKLFADQEHLKRQISDDSIKNIKEDAQKLSNSWKVVEALEPEEIPNFAVEGAQHRPSSTDVEGRFPGAATTLEKPPTGSQEGTENTKEKYSEKGQGHEDDKQPTEDFIKAKRFSPPTNLSLGATVPEEPAVGERFDSITTTDDESPLVVSPTGDLPHVPFQVLKPAALSESSHGVFWVCFPASGLDQSVKKYARVFNKVARHWRWREYQFFYLDTRILNEEYDQHFCDDINKITFVIEKKSDGDSAKKRASVTTRGEISNDGWAESSTESPAWFRRMFQPDQDIQASLIEEFLIDVHSGKLPEVMPPNSDL